MAYPSNRALIACSVLALASAIVTLYYWQQLRKRRKSSTPSDNACGEKQPEIALEEEEGDSQILNSLLLAEATAATSATLAAQTEVVTDDCLDGTSSICVEKLSATIANTQSTAPSAFPSSKLSSSTTKSAFSEMANEQAEVLRDDCRTDSICDSNSSPPVDSALEADQTAGAPELLTAKAKEPDTNDGGSDSKATDTVASTADSVTVVVEENRTPAAEAATSAGTDVVAAEAESSPAPVVQVDKSPKSADTAQISSPPPAVSEPEKDKGDTSAGAASTASAAASTSIRVAPAANSRKIITSNPVTRSITFAQVLSKKSTPPVPTEKQAKKMAKSSGPKPVDPVPAATSNKANKKFSGGATSEASKASVAASNKPVISYAAVLQESSTSSSASTSPSSSPGSNSKSSTNTTSSRTNKTPTPTATTANNSKQVDAEVADAYRNYPDASATASLSSSSVEGQCSPNSDLGEFTCDVRSLV